MPHIPGHPLSPSIQQLIDAGHIPDIFGGRDPGSETNVFGQPIGTPGPLDAPPDVFAPHPTGTAPFIPPTEPGAPNWVLGRQGERALSGLWSATSAIGGAAATAGSFVKDFALATPSASQSAALAATENIASLFVPGDVRINELRDEGIDEIITRMGFDPLEVRSNPGQRFSFFVPETRTWHGGYGDQILADATDLERHPPPEGWAQALAEVLPALVTAGAGMKPLTIEEAGGPLMTIASAMPPATALFAPGMKAFGTTFRTAYGLLRKGDPPIIRHPVVLPTNTKSIAEIFPSGAPVVHPNSIERNVLGLRAIRPGLSRQQVLLNAVKAMVGEGFLGAIDDPWVSAYINELDRMRPNVQSMAAIIAGQTQVRLSKAFVFNRSGQIPSLAGIDNTLLPPLNRAQRRAAIRERRMPSGIILHRQGTPPTIADVAARLPRYWSSLNHAQRQAMTELRNDLAPWSQIYRDLGGEIGQRPDILDGGFYVPRGNALLEGADEPFRVPSGVKRGARPTHEQPVVFETSQAQGIHLGYEYSPAHEAIQGHLIDIGNRATDRHLGNFLKAAQDPGTGELLGHTRVSRVPNDIRRNVTMVTRQIRGRNKTLIRQSGRISTLSREAARAERGAEAARGRVQRAGQRVSDASFDLSDIAQARKELSTAISEARDFAFRSGENEQRLRTARVALSSTERELIRSVRKLGDSILRAESRMQAEMGMGSATRPVSSGSLKRTVTAYTRDADRMGRTVDRLSSRAEAMSNKVDGLIEKGDILSDMNRAAREEVIITRKEERALTDAHRLFASAERELRTLQRESRRLTGLSGQAGTRAGEGRARAEATGREIQRFQGKLNGMRGAWDRAKRRAEAPERDYGTLDVPGLDRHRFPQAMVNATNEFLKRERFSLPVIDALNDLYRGLNATGDNSAMGIQGGLAAYKDPRAYGTAVRVSVHAWVDPEVLGRFLTDFDEVAIREGRLTALQLAQEGVHIGGTATEFELKGAIQRIPVIGSMARGANRAFGGLGDSLRLAWIDDEITTLLETSGRSLDDLVATGEIERLATAINRATGWTNKRFLGNLGGLILFAQRFFQSRLETIAAAGMGLRPGAPLDQRIARRSLVKMISIGTMLTIGINHLSGRDTDFRPVVNGRKNPNFVRVRFAGRDWTFFGTWDSMLGIFISVVGGRPQDVVMGMPSGSAKMAHDLLFNEDGAGESIGTGKGDEEFDAQKMALWLLRLFTPFAAEEIPGAIQKGADRQYGGSAAIILGEQIGAKSSPLSLGEVRDELRRAAMVEMEVAGDFFNLHEGVQDEINARPEIVKARQDLLDQGVRRGYRVAEYTTANDAITKNFNDRVEILWNLKKESKDFRDQLRTFYREQSVAKDKLRTDYKKALEYFAEIEPSTHLFNISLDRYRHVMFAEGMRNEITGDFDFGERDERRARLIGELGQARVDGIETHLASNDPKPIQELNAARDVLRPYFEVADKAFSTTSEDFPDGLVREWEEYQGVADRDKLQYREDNPVFKEVLNSVIPAIKLYMRGGGKDVKRNKDGLPLDKNGALIGPEIDRNLLLWGWITSPVHPVVIAEELARLKAMRE
jgi:hypothetical protein